MSHDPRVLALSTAIASVIVAVVDIARNGTATGATTTTEGTTTAPQAEAPRRQTRAKPEPAPTAADPKTTSTAPDASSKTSSGGTPTTTSQPDAAAQLTEAKALVMRVSKEKGRDTAVELLSKFDATSASTMDASHYTAFIAAATAVLAGASVEDAVGGEEGADLA